MQLHAFTHLRERLGQSLRVDSSWLAADVKSAKNKKKGTKLSYRLSGLQTKRNGRKKTMYRLPVSMRIGFFLIAFACRPSSPRWCRRVIVVAAVRRQAAEFLSLSLSFLAIANVFFVLLLSSLLLSLRSVTCDQCCRNLRRVILSKSSLGR